MATCRYRVGNVRVGSSLLWLSRLLLIYSWQIIRRMSFIWPNLCTTMPRYVHSKISVTGIQCILSAVYRNLARWPARPRNPFIVSFIACHHVTCPPRSCYPYHSSVLCCLQWKMNPCSVAYLGKINSEKWASPMEPSLFVAPQPWPALSLSCTMEGRGSIPPNTIVTRPLSPFARSAHLSGSLN